MGSSYSDVPYPEKNYPGPKIDARDPEAARRAAGDMGWIIMSHLIAGILLYTFLGWLLSLWLGNAPLLMAVGAVAPALRPAAGKKLVLIPTPSNDVTM